MPSNLRAPYVFVLNAAADFVRDSAKRPFELAVGKTGLFNPATGKGIADAAPAGSVKAIVVHKNIGNDDFGTYRSPTIYLEKISRWRSVAPAGNTQKVVHIGHNGTNGDICVPCGTEVIVTIHLYNRTSIARYYNPVGYRAYLPITTSCCTTASPTLGDKVKFADDLVAAINGTLTSVDGWPDNRELSNFITAAKVVGAGSEVGVSITGKAIPPEALNNCNPDQWHELVFNDFAVSFEVKNCDGCTDKTPVRTTVAPVIGTGFPLEVASLEKEAYGYNVNREHFIHPMYQKPPYTLSAQANLKYRFYHLEATVTDHKPGVQNGGFISEAVEVIFAVNDADTALKTALEDAITDIAGISVTSPIGSLL